MGGEETQTRISYLDGHLVLLGQRHRQLSATRAFDCPLRPSARLSGFPVADEQVHTSEGELFNPGDTTGIGGRYQMEIIVQPPALVQPASILFPPLVIALQSRDVKRQSGAREMGDISGVWAFASLITEDASGTLVPPRTELFNGRTADSIHIARSQCGKTHSDWGYAIFSDLRITQPGIHKPAVSSGETPPFRSLQVSPVLAEVY